jgi:hypothetical protein
MADEDREEMRKQLTELSRAARDLRKRREPRERELYGEKGELSA